MISGIFRRLPAFKGKQRLARMLLKNTIESSKDIVVSGKYNCTFKIPNIKENVGFEIFINGIYEKATVDFIVQHLKPTEVFIDIGANIGAISIPVIKQSKDLKVVCVEAAPWIFEYLSYNLNFNNVLNVTAINKAVSDASQKEVKFYSPQVKYGKGSLSPVFTTESVTIEATTLDKVAKSIGNYSIGLIKVDVEGFEYHVFLGGSEILKASNAPDILFEFVDWAEAQSPVTAGSAQALLIEYGYTIYYFINGKVAGQLKQPIKNGSFMFLATKKSRIIGI